MPQLKRLSAELDYKNSRMGPGIYSGRVINNLDSTFMGRLEVSILRDSANTTGENTQTFVVNYASPFFGTTPYEYLGLNTGENNTKDGFNDTQKSYGMWMVPPDIGVTVLVAFVDGDPSQGYWFACVPAKFANHMVPAIGASDKNYLDAADKKKYNTSQPLPVAEFNKRVNLKDQIQDVRQIKKPVHPVADAYLKQGLLEDDVRGVTTTTSRRESPSSVFGIVSPGPLDRRPGFKATKVGYTDDMTESVVPTGRLGGTSLVMDDGDERLVRKKPAGELGQGEAYADRLAGQEGDPTIPYNEYFRIRTRTGHQLLFHNSEDLVYIANSKGTAWIELTSNGKIDIYATDSISIHTENDLNIRADRDINLEAGRNINMKAVTGRIRQEAITDWEVFVGNNGKITVGNNYEHFISNNTKITTGTNFDLRTGGANKFTAASTTDIKSGGEITQSGSRIDLNSFPAKTAEQCDPIELLSTHDNVKTNGSGSWDKKYDDGTLTSIMKRIPMHEPWSRHENFVPTVSTPKDTDRET